MKIFKTNKINTIKDYCKKSINKPVRLSYKKPSFNKIGSSFFLPMPSSLTAQLYLLILENSIISLFLVFNQILNKIEILLFTNWFNFLYVIPIAIALIAINYLIICAINYRLAGSSERPTK